MRCCGTAIKSSIIINQGRQFRNIRCYAAAAGFANVRLRSCGFLLSEMRMNKTKSHHAADMLLRLYPVMAVWIMINLPMGYIWLELYFKDTM